MKIFSRICIAISMMVSFIGCFVTLYLLGKYILTTQFKDWNLDFYVMNLKLFVFVCLMTYIFHLSLKTWAALGTLD